MAELVKNRMPEETERGIMHWYHKPDSINTKVHSVVFTVDSRGGELWGVADAVSPGNCRTPKWILEGIYHRTGFGRLVRRV